MSTSTMTISAFGAKVLRSPPVRFCDSRVPRQQLGQRAEQQNYPDESHKLQMCQCDASNHTARDRAQPRSAQTEPQHV